MHFEHGDESVFDLIVGTDGTGSKVRPISTELLLEYVRLIGVHLLNRDTEASFPHLAAWVGQGSHFALGDVKASGEGE